MKMNLDLRRNQTTKAMANGKRNSTTKTIININYHDEWFGSPTNKNNE
jgi:hypothetical protein